MQRIGNYMRYFISLFFNIVLKQSIGTISGAFISVFA